MPAESAEVSFVHPLRRAVDRYGWLEAARRAPKAVLRRTRRSADRWRIARRRARVAGEATARVEVAVAEHKIDPASVVIAVDPVVGPQLVRQRSSDWGAYAKVFVDRGLEFDLGFEPRSIVVVGMRAGYSASFLARRYPGARIIAVEPDAGRIAIAVANFDIAGCRENVEVIQAAIWHRPVRLRLARGGESPDALSVVPAGRVDGDWVRGITMAQVMDRFGLLHADLVTIDVDADAAERTLFAEHLEWLERVNALVVPLHDGRRRGRGDTVRAAVQWHFRHFDESRCGVTTAFVRREPVIGVDGSRKSRSERGAPGATRSN
jgi:FkbM family methyltransferase